MPTLPKKISDQVKKSPHNKIRVAITDIDGVLRGKMMSKEKFLSAANSGFGFCDVVFGWDAADVAYDNVSITGWHSGYPDGLAVIDSSTYRNIPWMDGLPFFLADFDTADSHLQAVCPRSLLKRIIKECDDMGYQPLFSQEFEWFNFSETATSLREKNFQNLQPLTEGMFGYSLLRSSEQHPFFNDLFELLTQFGIPIEGLHTETGPGVYEAAIQYGPILEAADRAVLFKTAVKEIAARHQIIPTFMAKFSSDLPGCGGHVHQSLWNKSKRKNLFANAKAADNMSDLMRHYIAGQLTCLPEILPMFAPNINSFKRLVEGAWAPTTLTWGIENRTTALRAIPASSKACRLETRVIGSDTNPYLAMAACLASGLYGIQNKLVLKQAPTKGNGYKDLSHGMLPKSLQEASVRMQDSDIANGLFGEDFVKHFTQTRLWESRAYAQQVSDWELRRYFEII